MARKVILDVDPGVDDAVALTMALFDPRLEVEAVTAVAGNVSAEQSTRNVQTIIEQLDPPRLPRIGAAEDPEFGLPSDAMHIQGTDGLGNANFAVAELHHQHPSDKVITDIVRAAPEEVTIIALGPLTNLARAFRRDPALPSMVGQIVSMGGTVGGPGNVTAAAEFNIYCDPRSAREVYRSPTTKTIAPIDVTIQVEMTYDFMDQLPSEETRAGRFLRKILPFAYRAHHRYLGIEGVHLHDAVALVAATNPELFTMKALEGDVEVSGELTTGATVFDRRMESKATSNMDVAVAVDVPAVKDCILRGLDAAGRCG